MPRLLFRRRFSWFAALLMFPTGMPVGQAPAVEPDAQAATDDVSQSAVEPLTAAERRLLWRAGSGSIAGLSAARRGERAAERESAVAELRELLGADSARAGVLMEELEFLLSDPSRTTAWCVAARVVGAARIYSLAQHLSSALDPDSSPECRAAARSALRGLYGRWFASPEDLQPFLREVQPGPGTELLVDSALTADNLAVEKELARLELLRQDPERLLEESGQLKPGRLAELERLLTADDPRYRRGAARLMAQVARQTRDTDVGAQLWQKLAQRVGSEIEPEVFGEIVGLLVDEFSARAVAEEQLEGLRAQLLGLAERVEPRRALAVAEGLARLPWELNGAEGEQPADAEARPETCAHLGDALRSVGKLLERLIEGEAQGGVVEPEIVVGAISAANLLVSNVDSAALLEEEGVADLRTPLYAVLRNSSEHDVGVRIAALGPYAQLARGFDVAFLLRQIDDERTPPAYAHALLGVLAPRFFDRTDDESGSGLIFVAHVAALLEKTDDADLQKRALSYLADERLAPLVERTFAPSDPGPNAQTDSASPPGTQTDSGAIEAGASTRLTNTLLALLGDPATQPEVRGLALRLFGRVAGPELLGPFLALPTFESLASAGPKELGEMTDLLQRVAAGDPESLFALARSLVAVPDDKTRISRIRSALSLVASLDAQTASGFGPAEDSDICRWVLDLRAAGLTLEELFPLGQDLRERLLQVHLLGAAEGGTLEPWRQAHLRALLLASQVLDEVPGADVAQVDQAFEVALAGSQGPEHAFIQRDRARWRMARNTPQRALADYTPLRESDVLRVADIRAALAALDRGAPTEGEALDRYRLERVRWLRSLVERENWSVEATAVRLADLQAYVTDALALPPTQQAQVLPALADFFTTLPTPHSATDTPPERWQAFLNDPTALSHLQELQASVQAALTPSPAPEPAPSAEPNGGGEDEGQAGG